MITNGIGILREGIQKLINENTRLINENTRLINENEELKKELNRVLAHNQRGAGRKSKFDRKQIEEMKETREAGATIKEIATKYSCSIGLVHKLINEK